MAALDEEYKDSPAVNTVFMYISIFFLMPIFMLLMLYRMSQHRNYTHKKISDCRLKGTFAMFFYLVYVIGMLSSEFSATGLVAFSILFLLPSLYQFHKAKRIKRKLHKRLEQYQNYFMENQVTTIERLGKLTGERPEIVKNELLHWIYIGVLENIDVQANRVFIYGSYQEPQVSQRHVHIEVNHTAPHRPHPSREAVAPPPPPKPKTVQCHGCGASTTIMEGETKKCEYCENILS